MRTFGRVLLYYACICGGIWVGLWISVELFSKPEVERLRALDPDAFICGNMFLLNMSWALESVPVQAGSLHAD